METEEMEDSVRHPKAEGMGELVLKEEAEGSEDGMEEGSDDQRTGDDDEGGSREGEAANEPQDLSLADYSQYDAGTALPESHAGADGTFAPRAIPPRVQAPGKLSCDICGLSCVSINVLLVHKRSHTGEYRNTNPRKGPTSNTSVA